MLYKELYSECVTVGFMSLGETETVIETNGIRILHLHH